jgi:hypothetical protein
VTKAGRDQHVYYPKILLPPEEKRVLPRSVAEWPRDGSVTMHDVVKKQQMLGSALQ